MKIDNFYTFSEYMKDNELTIGEEDYLEMIYRLCLDNTYTRVSDLAQALNVKPPSVSNMIKRLANKKLIKHVEYGIIQLTKEGKKLGKYLLERHKIIEEFLILLNIKENILEETEKMEHTLSPETISHIKQLVAFFNNNSDVLTRYKNWLNVMY